MSEYASRGDGHDIGDPAIEPATTLANTHASTSHSDDSLDLVVGRWLDAGGQFDDLVVIATVRRRALAKHLAAYRRRDGDGLSARFIQLLPSQREVLLAALEAPDAEPKTRTAPQRTRDSASVEVSDENAEGS